MDTSSPLTLIGNNALVTLAGIPNVPAKIDTGATTSSVWATNIRINASNELEFTLFGPSSPFYTGQVSIRYRISLPIVIKGRHIRADFTLANRSRNKFPILIGRRLLKGKFLVDVSKVDVPHSCPIDSSDLNRALDADPQQFSQDYMLDK